MLPEYWPLVVYEKTKDQFEVVRKILNSTRISRVVCATDAGREGDLSSAISTRPLTVRSPLVACGSLR
jgi:DNA topoisomerase IA